jgi:uncharacterized glyoxalase superfamily protein PhnB
MEKFNHLFVQPRDYTNKMSEGPHVVIKPENTHWGTRWFMVEDPDGNQFAWQGPPK